MTVVVWLAKFDANCIIRAEFSGFHRRIICWKGTGELQTYPDIGHTGYQVHNQ